MHLVNYVAYLDAGTGSLIIQALIGIFAGVALFARRYIFTIPTRIASVFKRDKQTDQK